MKSIRHMRTRTKVVLPDKDEVRDKERISTYVKHRNNVGEELLRAALRCLAAQDAANMVNDLLVEKFNLSGVSVATREFDAKALSVFRGEVNEILTKNSILSPKLANILARRLTAQMIPTRDNIATTPVNPKAPERNRIEALEELIQREANKYAKK